MKLKSITIEGFHNVVEATYDLSNLTYFRGPNGVGKSTILQAIQLALLGYIPNTNKTKSAIFEHARSNMMGVTLKLDDNGSPVVIKRMWMGTKTNIKSAVEIYPEGYDVSAILGQLELPIFNFTEFLGLTPNKLKDWFIEFLPDSADSKIDWRTRFTEAVDQAGVILEPTDIAQFVEEANKLGTSGVESVRSVNQYLKSIMSYLKSEQTRITGAIQSLVSYEDVNMTIEDVSEELKIARERLAELQKGLADIGMVESIKSRIKTLTVEQNNLQHEMLPEMEVESLAAEIAQLDSDLKELTTRKEQLVLDAMMLKSSLEEYERVVSRGDTCPFLYAECDRLVSVRDDARIRIDKISSDLKTAENDCNQCSDSIERTTARRNNLAEMLRKQEYIQSRVAQLSAEIEDAQSKLDKYDELTHQDRESLLADIEFLQSKVDNCLDLKVKLETNKHYTEMLDTLSKDKFSNDCKMEAVKCWIKLTDVNGMQAESDKSFSEFSSQMDDIITKLFGDTVHTKFNLSQQANGFSFGLDKNGKYIPYSMLSSGEKCMYMLAMMLCLVRQSDAKLKVVLIDDLFDHLDDDNINSLFESLYNVQDIQMVFAGVKAITSPNCKDVVVELK